MSTGGGVVGRLLGRLIRLAIVLAAGAAGWIGIDRLAFAQDDTVPLPELGDGLPTARLNEPEPWRQFQLTYVQPDYEEHYWFDLDSWKIRSQVITPERTDSAEIYDDLWYWQTGIDGEWVEQDPATTRTIAGFAMGGVGPFLLTDLVPPGTLGFTTLELEGTSKGERVYEVIVDAATLELQHPLAYNRWITTTRILGDGSAVYRIRVRPDGYILRIDNGDAAAIWTDLPGGVPFQSPLADIGAVPPVDTVDVAPADTVAVAPVDTGDVTPAGAVDQPSTTVAD
ncbi:MAG: hypothetical protein HKN44_13155 [Ilumatobacter sp.]|nr:hypothetical protein [Ilumatobacter sp.]